MDSRVLILREGDRRKHDVNVMVDTVMRLPTDKPWEAEVRIHRPKGTEQQNRTWHMWITEIARAESRAAPLVKEVLKALYGPLLGETKSRTGATIQLLKSWGDYNKHERTEMMQNTQVYAAERGIELTQPAGDSTW